MFFLYFFRYLTFEEAIEALDCENVEIPSDTEDENFSEEDEVDFVPEDEDGDDDDDNNDDDDDTVDGEASCAEPTKKKRKKTERYLTFVHLTLEAFHCLIVFFYILQNLALGKEGLTRTCQPRKPPCS